jgi:signal transduction histidine kinase
MDIGLLLDKRVGNFTERGMKMCCETCEKLREETRCREAAESEVLRLSINLHDDICQRLAGISMFCKSLIPSADPRLALPDLSAMIDESLSLIRRYAHNSFPAEPEGGLEKALDELCRTVAKQSGRPCVFSWAATPLPDSARFNPTQEIHLYRITQEAVQNAVKHSGATRITVEARSESGVFTLTISDNGSGTAAPHDGIGLRSMRHRAEQLGATFSFDSSEKGGTCVRVEIR